MKRAQIVPVILSLVLVGFVFVSLSFGDWMQNPTNPATASRAQYTWRGTISSNSNLYITNSFERKIYIKALKFAAFSVTDTPFQLIHPILGCGAGLYQLHVCGE